jgi:hypothetical protein
MSLPMHLKRGLSYAEAMAYVGVKRRTFDEVWRPHLVAVPQGTSLVFDRQDLDALFDRFKADAAGGPQASNDDRAEPENQKPHNGRRNGRPMQQKGASPWAKERAESSATAMDGKSTNGGGRLDFASAVSSLTRKRNAG